MVFSIFTIVNILMMCKALLPIINIINNDSCVAPLGILTYEIKSVVKITWIGHLIQVVIDRHV